MKKLTILQIGAVIIASIALITWFKSDKLSAYWQQEYESTGPFQNISDSGAGKAGATVEKTVNSNHLEENLSNISHTLNETANSIAYNSDAKNTEKQSKQITSEVQKTNVEKQGQETTASADNNNETKTDAVSTQTLVTPKDSTDDSLNSAVDSAITRVNLNDGEKALFIGDSLMQGVAPWVMRKLQNDFHIDSINLSKHSTGLAFSKFFDWPATVEETLTEDKDVTVLFVFLGGNDGQSVVDPNTERHVKFGSERWDELYVAKIERILDSAEQKKVQVVWVTPPNMKSPSLNKKTAHLSDLFDKHVTDKRGLLLHSKEILQFDTANNKYSDSMKLDGKLIKVRTADGVHFTTKGQKVIAQSIMDKVDINGRPMTMLDNP